MFDVKTFPSSPSMARRLIAFSEISNLGFDDRLVDLAMTDLITQKDLEHFAFPLDINQLSAVQFVNDWQGRALLLGSDQLSLRQTALAQAFHHSGKLLILAAPASYHEWATMAHQVWPDAQISIFGNQRYVDSNIANLLPPNSQYHPEPDYSAQVFISSYGGVIWNNFLGKCDFDQTIIEEFQNSQVLNYKWETAVKGMARELPRPLVLQDLNKIPGDPGMNRQSSLHVPISKTTSHINNLLRDFVRAGLASRLEIINSEIGQISEYLKRRHYKNFDLLKLWSVFGVSSHLVNLDEPLMFYDDSLRNQTSRKASKQQGSGLVRFTDKERHIAEIAGRKMSDIVRLTLEGNGVMLTLIGQLMDTQWATLKASHIKSFSTILSNGLSKTLIIASQVELAQSLKIQLGMGCQSLVGNASPADARTRFLDLTDKDLLAVNNLVIGYDQMLDEELLKKANFVILTDLSLSRQDFKDLQTLAKNHDIKLVVPILLNSWEEEVTRQLI